MSFDKCIYSSYRHYNKNIEHFHHPKIFPVSLLTLSINLSHGSRENKKSICCYYELDFPPPKFHINGIIRYELWYLWLIAQHIAFEIHLCDSV